MRFIVLVGMLGATLVWASTIQAQLSYRLYSPQIYRAPLPTPTATLSPPPLPATETRTPTRTPTPPPTNCHPSYPTVCIPPPPDLDCGQIPFRNFMVLRPDVHRFDGDGDGVGCET